jgi:hypothetical protein
MVEKLEPAGKAPADADTSTGRLRALASAR